MAAAAPATASRETSRSRSPRIQASGAAPVVQQMLVPPAETSPAVGFPVYSDLRVSNWITKQVGKNAMGSPTICIYDQVTRAAPTFCLYRGEEFGTLVFPLEPRKESEPPAFMTGATPSKKVESLDLITTLEGDQVGKVQEIDEWCKQQAMDNAKDWFGRTCTRTEIDVMYTSPVKIDELGKYAPNLRAKMNLGGIDKFLTQVTFVRSNGMPEEGAGWEWVEPRLGEQKWRQHRARLVLEARRIWIVGKKFGLTYSITNIAVREKADVRPNPFSQDSTVEQLAALSY